MKRWETWAAVKQARRSCKSHPAKVRFCWDLDNTLANSGVLIKFGTRLQDAIVEAQAVPNMLALYEAIRTRLPEAEHFILSARMRSMRGDTLMWLRRHGVEPRDGALCFVPHPEAKPRVWRQLARDARLVIVDDLSYNHESDTPSVYNDLVVSAEQTASVYIGLTQITNIAAHSHAAEEIAARTVEALAG